MFETWEFSFFLMTVKAFYQLPVAGADRRTEDPAEDSLSKLHDIIGNVKFARHLLAMRRRHGDDSTHTKALTLTK